MSKYPGIGVMLNMLGGDNSSEVFRKAVGRTIQSVTLADNHLLFDFGDFKMAMHDDGQSCCENRYMVCDDDLASFAGSILLSGEIADAPNLPDEYGEPHEVQFLRIATDKGMFTVSNHNEHNGYYGGFFIRCTEIN